MQPFSVNDDLCEYQQVRSRTWKKHLQRFLSLFTAAWGMELLYFTFSILFMVMIIVLLAYYDGKPSSDRPSQVTLNAVIATGFTLSKGLMVVCVSECIGQHRFLTGHRQNSRLIDIESYDAASRGVIGAFWLILKPKIAGASLIGPVIIVAALAVDPFAQQLLNFKTRSIVVSADATLDVVVRFDGFAPYEDREILQGPLLNVLNTQSVNYYCPTGHCEWPDYLTLGFCSKCRSLTKDLKTIVDHSAFVPSNNASSRFYSAALPNGHSLSVSTRETEIAAVNISASELRYDPSSRNVTPTVLEFSSISLLQFQKEKHTTDFNADGTKFGYGTAQYSIRSKPRRPILGKWYAKQCTLDLCVQRRRASVRNGRYLDKLRSRKMGPLDCSYRYRDPSDPYIPVDKHWCVVDYAIPPQAFVWDDDGYYPPLKFTSLGWMWEGLTSIHNDKISENSFPMTLRTFRFWQEYLRSKFDLQCEELSNTQGTNKTLSASSPIAKAFLPETHGVDLPYMLRNVAEYLAIYVREYADSNSLARGSVYDQEVVVHVVWLWLLLPGILLCCTSVFLAVTIRKTKLSNTRPWKSSNLPLLLDGLEFSNETDYLVDVSESVERAKATPLALHRLWNAISKRRHSNVSL